MNSNILRSTAGEIAQVADQVIDAWSRYDAAAFAAAFTVDASQVLPGDVYLRGQAAITASLARGFLGPYAGTHLQVRPVDLREITSDVWVMISEGGVVPAGEHEIPADRVVRATWTIIRQDGAWRIAAYQNGYRAA
jgi:uncharacterized protein (TIGR02246 family)